jgi:hypothetical protein
VSSMLSGKLRSNPGSLQLLSEDDLPFDGTNKATSKASATDRDAGSDIELGERGLPFGNAQLEPEFQSRK